MFEAGDVWARWWNGKKKYYLLIQREDFPEGVIPNEGEEKWTTMSLEDGRMVAQYLEFGTLAWSKVE